VLQSSPPPMRRPSAPTCPSRRSRPVSSPCTSSEPAWTTTCAGWPPRGTTAAARCGIRRYGRLVDTGYARPPLGTMAERLVAPFQAEVPAGGGSTRDRRGHEPRPVGLDGPHRATQGSGGVGHRAGAGRHGTSGSVAVQGALAFGAARVIAAGRDPEALERLRGAGATTVSLAQDGPDGLEQALVDAVSETSPGLVLDYLWGPVTDRLRRAGSQRRGHRCEHGLRVDRIARGPGGVAARGPAAQSANSDHRERRRIAVSRGDARRGARSHGPLRRRVPATALRRVPAEPGR
jgi:hypothetical protein